MNSSIKRQSKKEERLESIKKAHGQKISKFTTRMEDYLEVISELIELKGYATPLDISNYMNVSPPSVTKMLRRLDEDRYIEYTKYQGLKLTTLGKNTANEIRQKHSDLLEFFEMLGIDNSTANQDVEGIEHHLNPKTAKHLRKFILFLKSKPELLSQFRKTSF
ncbi:MAG: metal-dependent transcriptional regulator [Nitrosopumilus sp.]|uniref:metal-dependent transcriptional regulator n=1 Tax=Nitrosopumilus sp. TaxID=2024843 RepID=UPI00292DD929|nr:iron dependent repressor, metal binding and dimerization domain protein [Nitrosopumilus sp.]